MIGWTERPLRGKKARTGQIVIYGTGLEVEGSVDIRDILQNLSQSHDITGNEKNSASDK